MPQIAGELTGGTIPWMVGPVTMEQHIAFANFVRRL
jgi:hypothetical protein